MSNPTTRPRPRPRPQASVSKPSVDDTSGESSLKSPSIHDVEDEDFFFMRNRSRDAQTWRKLEQLEREHSELPISRSSDEESSDVEVVEPDVLPSHKRNKKERQEPPGWTRSKGIARLLSDNLSDDDAAPSALAIRKGKGKQRADPSKRKRSRSRSRSITPPPSLPAQALENARSVVRATLQPNPRAPSPIAIGDDSTDTIVLDPELEMIAQNVRSKTFSQPSIEGSQSGTAPGGPEKVTIMVRWLPHPEDASGQFKTWGFIMRRHDTFKDLFEETADLAMVPSSSLIMSYENRRIFSSVTPNGLGIWAEAELEACHTITYDHIRKRRHGDSNSPESEAEREYSLDPASESESESVGGDKLKLILRAAERNDITVTVRPTTKCKAIVKEYLKRAGLNIVGKSSPALVLDGERLDAESEIGDGGLEDGDLVEVVGV